MVKRIALISDHASPLATAGGVDSGGQNIYVAQVAAHLARLGYGVDVFTRRDSSDLPDIVEWLPGVRVIHVPAGPPEFVPKEKLLPAMGEFCEWTCGFARRSGGYSLSHANFFLSGLASVELKRRLGVPMVVTFHALGRVRRMHQKEADRFPAAREEIEDLLIDEADAIVAECPQDWTDLTTLYGAPPRRLAMIPCGFDKSEFWPITKPFARRMLGLPREEPILLNIGRLVPPKAI
jgi:glycosyltransferase involved in cell wall biosynthesis